jgi:hypothetical protein
LSANRFWFGTSCDAVALRITRKPKTDDVNEAREKPAHRKLPQSLVEDWIGKTGGIRMNTEVLQTEAAYYRNLQDQLKQAYVEIDDETLTDTLEGLSEFPQLVEQIVRSGLEDEDFIAALKARTDIMSGRLSRLKERFQKKRQLVAWALGAAGMTNLKACDFVVSLCEGATRLSVEDEGAIPTAYFVPQPPKLDRAGVTATLKRGETLAGAKLVQGEPYITVSTR